MHSNGGLICQGDIVDGSFICSRCGFRADGVGSQVYRRCAGVSHATSPRMPACRHRGEALRTETCKLCGAREKQATVYACAIHGECSDERIKAGTSIHACNLGKPVLQCRDYAASSRLVYRRTSDLVRVAGDIAGRLPPDIDGVVGCPRSGMIPAAEIACRLHLPLYSLNLKPRPQCMLLNGGGRMWRPDAPRRYLLIDDSVYSGNRIRLSREAMDRLGLPYLSAACYVRPEESHVVELVGEHAPSPHLFEWNLYNNGVVNERAIDPIFGTGLAFDMDGVICEDCPRNDADEAWYRRWITQAKPLYVPRLPVVPLIVTFRLEKYRAETEDWLRRHRVRWNRLIMHPAATREERNKNWNTTRHKGEPFRRSSLGMFVESDPQQAEQIAAYARKPVICTDNGEVYQ